MAGHMKSCGGFHQLDVSEVGSAPLPGIHHSEDAAFPDAAFGDCTDHGRPLEGTAGVDR